MTKMQIWSKETPRRHLRKKLKKKVGLFEALHQLPLHPRLFFSFSWYTPFRLPFLFSLPLSSASLSFSSPHRSYLSLPAWGIYRHLIWTRFTSPLLRPSGYLLGLLTQISLPMRERHGALFEYWSYRTTKSSYFPQTFPACQFWLKINFRLRFCF